MLAQFCTCVSSFSVDHMSFRHALTAGKSSLPARWGARMDWGSLGSTAGRAALAFSTAFGGQLSTSGTAHLAALAVVAVVAGCACCAAGCALGWVLRGLLPELLPQLVRLARQPSPGTALAPRHGPLAAQRQPAPRGYRLD